MSDENKDVMQEENQNILELVDEDGNTVQIDGEDYIVCIPYNEEEEEVTEIVLFKIDKAAESEDCLSQVVDENLAERIYQEFKKRNADQFDFEN